MSKFRYQIRMKPAKPVLLGPAGWIAELIDVRPKRPKILLTSGAFSSPSLAVEDLHKTWTMILEHCFRPSVYMKDA